MATAHPPAILQDAARRQPSHADLQQRIALLEDELAARLKEAEIADYQMMRAYDYIMGLYNVVPSLLITCDDSGCVRRANLEAAELLGRDEAGLQGVALADILPEYATLIAPLLADPGQRRARRETEIISADGTRIPILLSVGKQQVDVGSDHTTLVLSGIDLRERRRLEVELRHAQKLEAIGQLAAGIAHEINTPMQFINDNLSFIGDSVTTLLRLVEDIERRSLRHAGTDSEALAGALREAREDADCDFLRQRLPRAVARALEGVGRVSRIIDGMRLFSHPGVNVEPLDLNALVESALTIARNEYKYVAQVDFDAGTLPPVPCVRGDIGQVVINLLTNAAHAIAERIGDSHVPGHIRIRTSRDGDMVQLCVEDDGCGIPEAVRERIYDPFFTTKAVGKGTGQGLAISRSLVVERHGGSIHCEPVRPHGTRFIIRLPLQPGKGQEQKA